ncbi:MAG TPA: hypothetical protein VGK75_11115 [Casimicrobiaceae bacterium]
MSGRREPGYPLDDVLCATAPKSPRLIALERDAGPLVLEFGEESI